MSMSTHTYSFNLTLLSDILEKHSRGQEQKIDYWGP